MGSHRLFQALALLLVVLAPSRVDAQEPQTTRTAVIEQAQADKAKALHPYVPNKVEKYLEHAEALLLSGGVHWHPFFDSAYAGGGFTLGAGYAQHVSAYNLVDFRGSFTFSGYKRVEAEFRAPRLFNRRGVLSVVGGWRDATQVAFYGVGTGPTSKDDRVNYGFEQPYASAALDFWPTRKLLVLRGGVELSQWKQKSGGGAAPSIEEVYTADTLPGLGAKPTYVHAHGGAALDWRTSPGYTRSGGSYGITLNDFTDQDDRYGFRRVDYEAIQHVPLLRDTWVLSLRGRVETTYSKDDQQIPFFMLPALGGGGTLRGFSSWRFRDNNSLLLQAEWRTLVNRFLDVALFYDAGKVTARRADLDFDGLKNDFGLGFRLHGPISTPLRIELAKSNEGLVIVFSSKATF